MAKLEVEIKLDTEALVRELKKAAEKIEAEKDRLNAWMFSWRGMMCSNCYTTFSDELIYMNRDHPIGDWKPTFCPECGAKLGHDKEASE